MKNVWLYSQKNYNKVMKKGLYITGLAILAVSSILVYTSNIPDDLVIVGIPTLIVYLILGATPFFINIKNINLVPLQIILFGISLMLGGTIVCLGITCDMATLFIFLPIPFIVATLLIWGMIRLAFYYSKQTNQARRNKIRIKCPK